MALLREIMAVPLRRRNTPVWRATVRLVLARPNISREARYGGAAPGSKVVSKPDAGMLQPR
jgi:hypothetical protein